jgi:hypothetical protein
MSTTPTSAGDHTEPTFHELADLADDGRGDITLVLDLAISDSSPATPNYAEADLRAQRPTVTEAKHPVH